MTQWHEQDDEEEQDRRQLPASPPAAAEGDDQATGERDRSDRAATTARRMIGEERRQDHQDDDQADSQRRQQTEPRNSFGGTRNRGPPGPWSGSIRRDRFLHFFADPHEACNERLRNATDAQRLFTHVSSLRAITN